ncbi:MAG: hypothetical protein A2V62_00330 [Nitrospirae bacterium RBG_19FT_COMBO_58_9]|nr:MAG: hypothetical protein A2V62_00330 [Nitrospirae bacterium RBG_19FT_COMBO_58_9]
MDLTSQIVTNLLASFRLTGNEGEDSIQFLWHEQGGYSHSGSAVFTLFIDRKLLQQTTIDVIRQCPVLFSGQSIERVSRLLSDFAKGSISVLGPGRVFFALGKDQSLLDFANGEAIETMSSNLQAYLNNSGQRAVYLLPLSEIRLSGEIVSDRLFWVPGGLDLDIVLNRFGRFERRLSGNQYPPYVGSNPSQPVGPTDSWIGCYEGSHSQAQSVMQTFLGALSMAIDFPKSRSFTYARSRFPKGHVAVRQNGACTMYYDRQPHLPEGLGEIAVSPSMLKMIGGLLVDRATDQRVQVALEYVAAGWQPIGRIGFLHNAIALDALFGKKDAVKRSILEGIETFASQIDRARARGELLYEMRNRLLHGESKSLESCPEYLRYHETFEIDPAYDQIRILRTCLWEMLGANIL